VADAFMLTPEEYVTNRHSELQARGLDNTGIFRVLRTELAELRFKAPSLSDRQLRRRIYG
jgi:hypothetical protein